MPDEQQLPQTFGRYVLRQLIAEGGMAEIFLAEQRATQGISKIVAVKRMLPHLCRKPEFVAMFLDEARLASRLSHPNIVQVFDFGEEQGRYYLAMEYLAGENISSVLRHTYGKKTAVPVQLALQILAGACDGLHFAHTFAEDGVPLNVVHRDISPTNIMVTYQGGVKVVDFGIARAVDRQSEETATGVVKGKIPYCSPEQLKALKVDARSDLFSLGIVLYEMLTGRRLFRRDSEVASMMAVLNDPIPPPSEKRPDIPKELDAIVLKALAREPNERYQTGRDMRRDLEACMKQPFVRIDEWIMETFGEDRMQQRLRTQNASSSSNLTPYTASSDSFPGVSAMQELQAAAGETKLPPPLIPPALPQRASAPRALPAPVEDPVELPTRALALQAEAAPAQVQPQPIGSLHPAAPPRPLWKIAAAIAGAAVVAASVGAWIGTRPPDEAAPPPKQAAVTPPQAAADPLVAAAGAATGVVTIDTLPRGARVELGGRALPNPTPTEATGVAAGEWVVQASLPGYRTATSVVKVAPQERKSLVLTLVGVGTVQIDAPEKAIVKVDGRDIGAQRQIEVDSGPHAIQVTAAGYQPFDAKVQVAPGEVTRVEAALVAERARRAVGEGKLDVSCIPWCRVFVDGKDVGKPSPVVGFGLSAGRHKLKLEHPPSGRTRELTISVEPGKTRRESADFR